MGTQIHQQTRPTGAGGRLVVASVGRSSVGANHGETCLRIDPHWNDGDQRTIRANLKRRSRNLIEQHCGSTSEMTTDQRDRGSSVISAVGISPEDAQDFGRGWWGHTLG